MFTSSLSILFFGLAHTFVSILFCRFTAGFFSNSSQILRKFLHFLITSEKKDYSAFSKLMLFAYKLGMISTIAISGYLLNPIDFLQVDSNFVKNRFLLSSLLSFLLQLSGTFLVFSIENGYITSVPKKYVKLSEEKTKVSEISKPKPDIENIFQSSVNENIPSEESVGPEEIKYFSPRGEIDKICVPRTINSARPKSNRSFDFSAPISEKKQKLPVENDGKKTHISFIEEDFENIQELHSKDIVRNFEMSEIKNVVVEESHTKFATQYRFALTFVFTLVFECFPYTVILVIPQINTYFYSSIILCGAFSSVIGSFVAEKAVKKWAFSDLISTSLIIIIFCILLLGLFYVMNFPYYLILLAYFLIFFCFEIILPSGCVMISDSVKFAEREEKIENSNFFCIFAKMLGSLIGPVLISTVKAFYLWLFLVGVLTIFIWWKAQKIEKYFPNMKICPYNE